MAQRPVIFLHNQSDDATIQRFRGEPSVVLNPLLVREIRIALGIAGPRDPTVLLLQPKFIKRHRPKTRARALFATVTLAVLFVTAIVFAHG
jgi:hypothetical protein